MSDSERISSLCRALSVETRVRIVELLRRGPLCVGALSARLDASQSSVSQHLRVLRDAGLVVPERKGYYIHYRTDKARLTEFLTIAGRAFLDRGEDDDAKSNTEGGDTPCAAKHRNARTPKR